ncbi:MAG: VWA domain-containing protein [Planctomycetota bacterium]
MCSAASVKRLYESRRCRALIAGLVLSMASAPVSAQDAAGKTDARPVPRGLAGVDLTEVQVAAAIDNGSKFLWQYVQQRHEQYRQESLVGDGPDLLAALALVHADTQKRAPEFDRLLRAYLQSIDLRGRQLPTYECGLLCLLIEAYGEPVFSTQLRAGARLLVELQGSGGSWGYGRGITEEVFSEAAATTALSVFGGTDPDEPTENSNRLERKTEWNDSANGDNSVSQFALLGLRAASRWHLPASPEVWRRCLAAYRSRQCADGGWSYETNNTSSYGSMTCAGLCALAICSDQLGVAEPMQDEQVRRGLAWLANEFSIVANPRYGSRYHYYYLYSVERVGRILDTEFIGSHEWYPLGAKFLVNAQRPDGRWVEADDSEDPRLATSFALLFLTRATRTLRPEIERHGSGELRTTLTAAPPKRLYIILDASGSMLGELDGRLKFDCARAATAALLALVPAGTQTALRVYGHRRRAIDPGADEDSELLIPMSPYDAVRWKTVLETLRARGKTPLAYSIEQAAQDLGGLQSATDDTLVVLLTDGGEDTAQRRDPVRAAEALGRLRGIKFHVLGFDVNRDDWTAQLKNIAAATNGQYWFAAQPDDLLRTLRAALFGDPETFAILNADAKEVQRGRFGDSNRLPEGAYTFVTQFDDREFRQPFWINTNAATTITFDASRVRVDTTATKITTRLRPVANPEESNADATPARHCANCKDSLAPDAKFCGACGKKVE